MMHVLLRRRRFPRRWQPVLLLLWVALLGFFFANFEIQVEGGQGWATGLPTWRIEHHWVLDIIWGGRALTGYHFWVFSFMALVFHLPVFATGRWSLIMEARVLGSVMVFWIVEDFLWFALNPAYGLSRFRPACIPWHHVWLLGLPQDYVVFTLTGLIMIAWSYWMTWRSVLPRKAFLAEAQRI